VLVQPWMTPQCSLLSFSVESTASTAPYEPALLGGAPIGGQSAANVNSTLVQRAALCAVSNLNARSNAIFQSQLVQVVGALQQVVSGVKLQLVFTAAPSLACPNDGSTPNLARCPVDADSAATYQVRACMRARVCVCVCVCVCVRVCVSVCVCHFLSSHTHTRRRLS
jgi:hypothetical protein